MIGFTTVTFRNKSIEEIIDIAKKADVDGIEWGGDVHVTSVQEAHRAKNLMGQMAVTSYGTYYKCENNEIENIIEIANALDAPTIRVWCGSESPSNNTSYEELVSKNLKKLCTSTHRNITLEYHRGTLTENYKSTLNILNKVDCKNLFTMWQPNPDISYEEHFEEIKNLKPYIKNVHVFNWENREVKNQRFLLRDNLKKWSEYINLIGENNYILEFVKDNRDENFISDINSLKGLI
ncbi:MAG: sugar phosphate isomerase/epimerase family protein [Lachnospirales bacterium]